VSIDGLGTFRPSNVRLEGDDPLAVAVIVDASDPAETMWRDLPKAVERILPALNPQDRLTLYGMDGCKAYRYVPEDAPLNAALVHAGLARAMTMTPQVRAKAQPAMECPQSLTMADMISYVVARLHDFSGRRMIVMVGGGAGYATRMAELKQRLNAESTMLLPLVHDSAYAAMPAAFLPRGGGAVSLVNGGIRSAYGSLAELAEYSGGRVRYLASHEFASSLAEAVAMARGRYILEFPRPDTLGPGHYRISVTDGHARDFVRASGISVPVANADEIAAARAGAQGSLDLKVVAQQATPAAQPASVPSEAAAPSMHVDPQVVAHPAPPAAKPVAPQPELNDISGELQPNR
jgi:hypothetical protein